MSRSLAKSARVPAVLALAAIAACVVNLDFNYTQANQVVQATATNNQISTTVLVDLSNQPDIQAHASSIESLSLNNLTLTITAVQSDNSIQSVTGSLYLRPSTATDASQDVLVGALNNFSVAANSTVTVTGSAALDAFALSTVKGSRKFYAVISGTVTGGATADFTADVAVSCSMGYDTGI